MTIKAITDILLLVNLLIVGWFIVKALNRIGDKLDKQDK